MITVVKQVIKKEQGQSIIEMVLFLPLMVLLFVYLISISASINGAINQQKITRSYFFARLKNNSLFPFSQDAENFNWSYFGMSFIGWREKFSANGEQPVLPCYLAKVPFFDSDESACGADYQGTKTNYVRVGTVFGICGANYRRIAANQYHRGILSNAADVASRNACTIQTNN